MAENLIPHKVFYKVDRVIKEKNDCFIKGIFNFNSVIVFVIA